MQFAITNYIKGECDMYIFRTTITRNGQKIYAKDYGKKAFRLWIGPEPEPKSKKKK